MDAEHSPVSGTLKSTRPSVGYRTEPTIPSSSVSFTNSLGS